MLESSSSTGDSAENLPEDGTSSSPRKPWPDYRAVWRWHFYASLFCLPFVLILSLSGATYLFKEEIEAWEEQAYDQLSVTTASPATAARQIQAALAAVPESRFASYELPEAENMATRVIVRAGSDSIRVFVHPQTVEVLGTLPEKDRFMRVMRRLHGELWVGEFGSHVVELAASWTIIMIVTGLWMWWPRHLRGLAGVLYPRLHGGTRMFWRDLHSVTGAWISSLALFLLLSGLPWSKFWGDYLKTARRITGTAVARQDWSNSGDAGTRTSGRKSQSRSSGEHGEHGGSSKASANRGNPAPAIRDFTPVDRIVATVQPLGLEPPVVIAPPGKGSTYWTAKSMTANRPWRENLELDGDSGTIVSRDGFSDRHLIDQIVAVGIAAHEGRLFGWPNQVLGLLTAGGLSLLCCSGVVLWWRRAHRGELGAPRPGQPARLSWSLLGIVVGLGTLLPLFGASLLLVLLTEWLVLRRLPGMRDWLGLA